MCCRDAQGIPTPFHELHGPCGANRARSGAGRRELSPSPAPQAITSCRLLARV